MHNVGIILQTMPATSENIGEEQNGIDIKFQTKGDFSVAQLIWVDYERGWC